VKIDKLHAGRVMVLKIFRSELKKIIDEKSLHNIAIVGGNNCDPEVITLKQEISSMSITTFGIEETNVFLDLNCEATKIMDKYLGTFDLVICCQVLEHTWNLAAAVQNITLLLKKGGLVWVNVPASNHKHMSPSYNYAGIQSETLEFLFKQCDVESLLRGEVGSPRLYNMTHKQMYWPTWKQLRNPFMRGVESNKFISILKFVKYFGKSMEAMLWKNTELYNSIYSTETYFLGKKTNGRA
jgi:SAM-dependent methyltransferase